ncbi:MAG: Dabb family protein [Cytophagaceae bacterium]|nr:Dabb family protein [Cytophagaceae bacterium]MBL0301504.1 Dabb family protein [Cytophagaceae bacterium]MBL0324324.1 Dabb family protein [Cytophagaceae bacterium]
MKNQNRRAFLQKSAVLAAIPVVGIGNKKTEKAFIHHVYFYLKENNQVNREKLIEGLTKLSKVPTIKSFHIGLPASTNRSVIVRDYSVSWMCFFENLEEEEIYQKHLIHLKFVEDYSYLWEKVNVYDSVDI